jgi:hypothetical protein
MRKKLADWVFTWVGTIRVSAITPALIIDSEAQKHWNMNRRPRKCGLQKTM